MTTKTKKNKKIHNKTAKTAKKVSTRVLEMWKDTETVWGKNKPLENFWNGLARGKYVVVIYKNGQNKYVTLPRPHTQKSTKIYNDFDDNKEIEAVLSSNSSQDAYEVYLYPKAKQNSVDYVIKNYKKYFKPMAPPSKHDIENGAISMKKVMVPS
jgi:hypothetical protein